MVKKRMRRLALGALLVGALFAVPTSVAVAAGGPIALVGIDAEDGSPFSGHGPIANYAQLVNNVLANASKNTNTILVIGGGKSAFDDVTFFWNAIDAASPASVVYVNGAAAISAVSFTTHEIVAVISDDANTSSGGLTLAEDSAIDGRQADIAAHVNSGGGLIGFMASFQPNPYGYVTGVAPVTAVNDFYSDITATAAGLAVGINDALDVCCWHDIFTAYPSFLSVLAYKANTLEVAALGGANVIVPTGLTLTPPTATTTVGQQHCVTANLVDQNGNPVAGATIVFQVAGANTATGTATTDASGNATFCYTSTNAGTDTITAFADSDNDGTFDPTEPVATATNTVSGGGGGTGTPCKVTGGGSTAPGNNFGFNAQASGGTAKGNVNYLDKAAGKHLKGADVTSVTCSGNQFTIVGTGTVGGAAVSFRVTGKDMGEPGVTDQFHISWSGGDTYASPGAGVLTNGNIQIH